MLNYPFFFKTRIRPFIGLNYFINTKSSASTGGSFMIISGVELSYKISKKIDLNIYTGASFIKNDFEGLNSFGISRMTPHNFVLLDQSICLRQEFGASLSFAIGKK
jgi:hypothetical protein